MGTLTVCKSVVVPFILKEPASNTVHSGKLTDLRLIAPVKAYILIVVMSPPLMIPIILWSLSNLFGEIMVSPDKSTIINSSVV